MASNLQGLLDEFFDCQLVYHGYTSYMRDYERVVYQSVDPNPKYGLVPRHLRFLFRICPEVAIRSRLKPDIWATSLSDDLLNTHSVTRESVGYVWGVAGQILYPGASIVEPSSPSGPQVEVTHGPCG